MRGIVQSAELAVWLAMPGLENKFHVQNLRVGWKAINEARKWLPTPEDLKDEIRENWMSATRQDCVRLALRRPFKSSGIPLLSQLSILDDIKRGMSLSAIAREYGTTHVTVINIRNEGPRRTKSGWDLPEGFSLLTF